MYVQTSRQEFINKRWNNVSMRRVDVFCCDECGVSYVRRYRALHSTLNSLTFCSKVCEKKSRSCGKLSDKNTLTLLSRYGVTHPSLIEGATDKMLATRLERYGTVAPIHHNVDVSKRWRFTMRKRYGADCPLQSQILKEKRKKTVVAKFGQDPLALAKNRNKERLSEAGQKGYRSLFQKRGNSMLSKSESQFATFLCENYTNVVQQFPILYDTTKTWLIDFYLPEQDTYIQFDGMFWHGLDKSYNELHPRAKESYDRDRKQDEWFYSRRMKLVRITDKEFLACQKKCNYSDIVAKLGGYENRNI